jgi:uncharacterized protein (TIGR00255 family)
MRSMTGYGEASGRGPRRAITVTMKAVNHRFLDLQLRLGDEARSSEAALRELLARELVRGRVEVRVEARTLGEGAARVEVDTDLVRAVHRAMRHLADGGLLEAGLTAGDVLRIPTALRIEAAAGAGGWEEGDEELLAGTAAAAVAQLVAGRETEGAALAAVLRERLVGLEGAVERLDELRGPALEEGAAALRRRVAELLEGHGGQGLDEGRVAQEVALMADRGDVSEEIDRLRSHVSHFRRVMAEAGANGKRLDFLTQEIFRELNTLGAKCRNAEMIRVVLDAKVLCEQVREQVQNVE